MEKKIKGIEKPKQTQDIRVFVNAIAVINNIKQLCHLSLFKDII